MLNMKKTMLAALCLLLPGMGILAVEVDEGTKETHRVTVYEKFVPAKVTTLKNGLLRLGQANIFLKNSTLLYKSGSQVKQAAMANIKYVDIAGRRYERIDTLLAYEVDTIGKNRLMCAQQIDVEAFVRNVAQNRTITNLDIGTLVSVTSVDLMAEEDLSYPIINLYFLVVDGTPVRAADRSVLRVVPKDKRRMYRNIIERAGFNWEDPRSLMQILYLLSK